MIKLFCFESIPIKWKFYVNKYDLYLYDLYLYDLIYMI